MSNQVPFKEVIIPDLFPGVNALRNAGITTFGQIPKTTNELVALDGIGVVISEKILNELKTQQELYEESLKTKGTENDPTNSSVEDQQEASQENKSPDAPPAVPKTDPADASDFNTHTPDGGDAGGAAGDNLDNTKIFPDPKEKETEPLKKTPDENTASESYKQAALRRARNRR